MRLSRDTKIVFLVCFLAVLVACYAVEAYLRIGFPGQGRDRPPGSHSLIEETAILRSEGRDVVPYLMLRGNIIVAEGGSFRSVFDQAGKEWAPLGNVSEQDTVFCNEQGFWLRYQADRFGFNNPDDVWDRQSVEVATIGDSFTHGSCVPPEDHMIGQIRAEARGLINLGRMGTGPLFQAATVREYLKDVEPKVVLWFFMEHNDIDGDLHDELLIPLLAAYQDPAFSQDLIEKQPMIDKALTSFIDSNIDQWVEQAQAGQHRRPTSGDDWISTEKVMDIVGLQYLRNALGLTRKRRKEARLSDLQDQYESIVRMVRQDVESWGGELRVVYLPAYYRYTNFRRKMVLEDQRQRFLKAYADLDIPVIDLVPVFNDHPDPAKLWIGHYDEVGYRMVADTVIKALRKDGYLSDTP